MRLRTLIVVAAGLVAVSAVPAQATIIPVLISVAEPGPGFFLWTYRAEITTSTGMDSGTEPLPGKEAAPDTAGTVADYVTIYDFAGFTGLVQFSGEGFDSRSYLVGTTPAEVNPIPPELVDVANVTIFRTGAEIVGPDAFFFALESSFGEEFIEFSPYAAAATDRSGTSTDGRAVANTGDTQTPFRALQQVPEPGTLLLVGAGLLGLGIYRRKQA